MLHGAFGKFARNAPATIIGVCGYIGNEINALIFMPKWNQAGIADDPTVFIPNITGQRQGCGLGGAVGPLDERIIVACAAHILHISSAIAIHGIGEADFDQIGHGGQVAENGKRTKMGLRFCTRRKGNGIH